MDMMEFFKQNSLTLHFESTTTGTISRNVGESKISLTLIDFDSSKQLEAIYLGEGISPGRHIPCGVVGTGRSIWAALENMFKQIQGKTVAMMNTYCIPAEKIREVTFPEVIRRNELESLHKELLQTIGQV